MSAVFHIIGNREEQDGIHLVSKLHHSPASAPEGGDLEVEAAVIGGGMAGILAAFLRQDIALD